MPDRSADTYQILISRPPEVVFAYLADVSRHAEWSPKPFRVEGAAGQVRAGDRFSTVGVVPGDKSHRNDVTVIESSPPERLVLDSVERGEHFVNTFELTPQGNDTLLSRQMDAPRPSFPLSLLFPLIKAVFIRPDVEKGLRNLKRNLESGVGAGA